MLCRSMTARDSTPQARPTISAWRLARWVWGQHRARAILEAPDRGAAPMLGVSTDGCARIAEIARLGCRVDTSGVAALAAEAGVVARLDEDAALVHCRAVGSMTQSLALVVRCAESGDPPVWDLGPVAYAPVAARNGKARVYDPRVETHDQVRQPRDPARPTEDRYAPAAGPYCKVYPDPSDLDVIDARDTWRRFIAGLDALSALLADQPLRRWQIEPGRLGVAREPWGGS